MTKQDKENLQNKKLTDSLLISCLAACDVDMSKGKYIEKLLIGLYENNLKEDTSN